MCRKCELTVLFSTDHPFHQPSAAAVGQFFDTIPDPADCLYAEAPNGFQGRT